MGRSENRNTEGRIRLMSWLTNQVESEFNLPVPFCSIQDFKGLDDAPPH